MEATANYNLANFISSSAKVGVQQQMNGILGKANIDWKTISANELVLYGKGTSGLLSILDTTITIKIISGRTAQVTLVGVQSGSSKAEIVEGHGGLYFTKMTNMPYGIDEFWLKREGDQTRFSAKKGFFYNFWIGAKTALAAASTDVAALVGSPVSPDGPNLDLQRGTAVFGPEVGIQGTLECFFPMGGIKTLTYSGQSKSMEIPAMEVDLAGVFFQDPNGIDGAATYRVDVIANQLSITFFNEKALVGYFEGLIKPFGNDTVVEGDGKFMTAH